MPVEIIKGFICFSKMEAEVYLEKMAEEYVHPNTDRRIDVSMTSAGPYWFVYAVSNSEYCQAIEKTLGKAK